MRIIDISMPIRGDMPTYKERPEKAPLHTWAARLPHDSVNESVYTINVHTGTHLDAPLHMTDGDASVDTALPLERLITKARVFDLTHIKESIEDKDLRDLGIEAGEFVLLKTANSYDPRSGGASFVFLKESGARYLAEKMISGVGIDALGIERDQPGHLSHHPLMDKGIIILEGLILKDAPAGSYTLIALPLKLVGAEGAPARAVLVEGLM